MLKVLVTGTNYSKYCIEAKALLKNNGFCIIVNTFGRPFDPNELKDIIADIDAVIAGLDIWNEEIFKVAKNLKIIARLGVGIDNIDLLTAKEYGIIVTNARGSSNSVAELTVALIFGILRRVPALDTSLKIGHWDRFVGKELKGMNIGIIGFGEIGQLLAKKLRTFEVQLFAYDKYPDQTKLTELGVELVPMKELLSKCDIISLHAPYTKDTFHLLSFKEFDSMKDGAYLINTARGALVDEAALYQALKNKKLAGAAIDVFESEPALQDNPIFQLDNIICTPHTGAETYETYNRTSMITAEAIIDFFKGKIPKGILNL